MWLWLSLTALLCWSGSDLFSKIGCRDGSDRYSHLKMVIAVGVVMGLHAAFEIFVGGTAISWSVIWTYLPVSLLYISSMALGYLGLRYIELSVSSPICNSSGALVAVIVAGVSGYFLGSGGFGSKGVSAPVFAESELDATVATWKFKGASHKISAREAIESQYSLDSVKDEDGNYPAPSADAVLSYVRNRILLEEASKQGIELSDEDLSSSAEASLGTSDFSAIADQYGVSEDQAKQIVREQGTIQKLYQSVMDDAPAMPKAPAEPESGDENEAKAEYAAYIIDLAGKEWDAEAGTWAKLDGAYATALAGEEITPESATYAQAQKAYAVAYQQYMLESQGANAKWTSYVNELFGEADVELFGLYA